MRFIALRLAHAVVLQAYRSASSSLEHHAVFMCFKMFHIAALSFKPVAVFLLITVLQHASHCKVALHSGVLRFSPDAAFLLVRNNQLTNFLLFVVSPSFEIQMQPTIVFLACHALLGTLRASD